MKLAHFPQVNEVNSEFGKSKLELYCNPLD